MAGCASPKSYSNRPDGSHAFGVKAMVTAGNADATPAGRTWTNLSSASQAARRAEEFGEDRFALLRDQHARPELLHEECRVLLDEFECGRWERLGAQERVKQHMREPPWSMNA